MPYKSDKQRKYFHAAEARGDISPSVVDEFDEASKGMHLPEKKKKKMSAGGEVNHHHHYYSGGEIPEDHQDDDLRYGEGHEHDELKKHFARALKRRGS